MFAARAVIAAMLVTSGFYYDEVSVKVTDWSQYVHGFLETWNVSLPLPNLPYDPTADASQQTPCVPIEPSAQDLENTIEKEVSRRMTLQKGESQKPRHEEWQSASSDGLWWFVLKEIAVFMIGLLFVMAYSRKKIVVHKAANDTLQAQLKTVTMQKDEIENRLQSTVAGLEAEQTVLEEKLAKSKAIARRMTVEERNNYPVPDHLFPYLRKINVCVTGPCGGGKSSLINALLSTNDEAGGAEPTVDAVAPVGWIETTKKPIPFLHPEFPDVVLWDCPGVGTRNFPADAYVRSMGLKHFACVVIVSSTRFTENDHLLRAELDRVRLPYFCIRSKFDQDRDSLLKHMNRNFKRASSLDSLPIGIESVRFEEMKEDLRLQQGIRVPYVLSSFEKDAYDFPKFLRHFHARLTQFSKERPPMLACEVCGNEEVEADSLLSCCYCRYFVCVGCSERAPSCESCPDCHRPASYKSLGVCEPDDEAENSEVEDTAAPNKIGAQSSRDDRSRDDDTWNHVTENGGSTNHVDIDAANPLSDSSAHHISDDSDAMHFRG